MAKALSEKETRVKILQTAKKLGCEGDVIEIFNKIDSLLRNCTNQQEREAIALLGVQQVHHLVSRYDAPALIVNGKIIT